MYIINEDDLDDDEIILYFVDMYSDTFVGKNEVFNGTTLLLITSTVLANEKSYTSLKGKLKKRPS